MTSDRIRPLPLGRTLSLIGVVAILASGCSLLVDTAPYVGNGETDAGPLPDGDTPDTGPPEDAGPPVDAGPLPDAFVPDAQVDPDGPTQPVVSISPTDPTTISDLTMSIDTASTDPLEAGPVTYEISWQRSEAATSFNTETILAADTAKAELWRVIVTPVASDARRGVPGVAEVTIGNTPPVLRSVRLDTYRPVAGDALNAVVGDVDDLDNDATAINFRWFQDDVEIAGQVASRLVTDVAAPGAVYRVEATVRDADDDGNTAVAGPAIALSDETRWRQLLPSRAWDAAHLVTYDARNDRVIMMRHDGRDETTLRMWEFALDGSGGFTQLFPTGPVPPLAGAQGVWDSVNDRLLIFTGTESATAQSVFALDVSMRGSESISLLSPLGAAPPRRLFASYAVDEARGRVLAYGGIAEGGAFNELWTLDVSTPGSEQWNQELVTMPLLPIIAGGFLVDEARNRLLLISGAEIVDPNMEPPVSDKIYSLDLTDPTAGFAQEVATVVAPRFLVSSVVDTAADRAILAFGGGPGDTFFDDWVEVDLDTLLSTAIEPMGATESDRFAGGLTGFIVGRGDDLLIYPGSPFPDATAPFNLYTFESGAAQLTPLYEVGVGNLPGAREMIVGGSWETHLFGGVDHFGDHREDVYQFRSGELMQITVQPDAVDGTTPGPRAGAVLQGYSGWGELDFFGGTSDRNVTANGDSWRLENDRWVHLRLASGSLPRGRDGTSFFQAACGGSDFGYVGGRDSNFSNASGIMQCTGASNDCSWRAVDSNALTARAWATASRLGQQSDVVLFGGDTNGAPLNDVMLLNVCSGGTPSWRAATVSGPVPAGRWGHSMLLAPDNTPGALERLVIFGGRDASGDELDDLHQLTHLTGDSYRFSSIDLATDSDAPSARRQHAVWWDSQNDRMMMYGGEGEGDTLGDLWELRLRD